MKTNISANEITFLKRRLLINSIGIYITSFITVKLSIIAYKLVVALVFQITPGLQGFRLFGENPPDSPVWDRMSVLLYFSADIIVPAILLFATFLLWLRFRIKKTKVVAGILWLGFSSIQILLGGIAAGIIAKTNQYFFFSWLNIEHFRMIIIALTMMPALMVTGMFYNTSFLITKPANGFGETTADNRIVLKYSLLYPVIAGTLILSLATSLTFGRYEAVELACGVLLALPVLFFIKIENPPKNSTGYAGRIYMIPLISAGIGITAFLIANLLLRK